MSNETLQMAQNVEKEVLDWIRWDKNEETLKLIQSLVEKNAVDELNVRLGTRMEFGTAGIRAKMGAGYSMMNDLTIIQTTQGLAHYLQQACANVKEQGVVVGYDGRHNSKRFAELTSTVLINAGIPVYLYSKITPTPFVPYCILQYKCVAGIMVTASHNPKEDNGYKVYWNNGAQIISPHDKGISKSIGECLEPLDSSWNTSIVSTSVLRKDPLEEIMKKYFTDVQQLNHHRDINASTTLTFTYTAMHGVGYTCAKEVFKAFNFKPFVPVKEQIEPDPEFPTVKFPNPEEGKSALDLAIKTANENDSTVILANDPDADRLAVAEKQTDGSWKVFNGNELGTLFCWWLWESYRKENPNSDAKNVYMISSTVSSKIIKSIAFKEGFNYEETLTGFKWMGNKADAYVSGGKTVLLAFEEAIGFMCGTMVLDKDGISAMAVMAEMAAFIMDQYSRTINQQLEWIFSKYGWHVSNNSYWICHDAPTIKAMFQEIRNYRQSNEYPKECGSFKIKYIRDLTTGFDNEQPSNKAILPVSSSSQMITFKFENGCVATLRTSGTEPKIKYYTEYVLPANDGKNKEEAEGELQKMVECIVEYFLQPKKFNLIPRGT